MFTGFVKIKLAKKTRDWGYHKCTTDKAVPGFRQRMTHGLRNPTESSSVINPTQPISAVHLRHPPQVN